MKTGEQAWNCYGNRSNKFLLVNYGFCFADNRYDSFSFKLKMDVDMNDLFVPFMIDFNDENLAQEVRIKNDQLCQILLSYFRSVCKV